MSRPRQGGKRLVYSTGPDGAASASPRACKRCGGDPCSCEPTESLPPASQNVRVRRDRSGRKGKTVTVVGPLKLLREDATRLLKDIKKRCGSGGTLKARAERDGSAAFELEIQGDVVDRVVADLVASGYRAKRSGG